MKWLTRTFIALIVLSAGLCEGNDLSFKSLGAAGAGIFIPTGDDADIARTSPIAQLSANVMFSSRVGFDAEFQYIPVLLESTTLPAVAHRKATQLALMAGLRATTSPLSSPNPLAYLAMRTGFARIAIRTNSAAYSGGWIGRSVDSQTNPNAGLGSSTEVRQKGFVLSPKAGAIIPIGNRNILDLAISPMFIFDSGDITSQYHITLSFGRITQ
ncbi:MAG: hypothetical protein QGG64_05910 [Candidatus Latescibacteria bacterium]|nr:hypothetical protein [Candidatus Latescibacterota bacterium]